MKLVKRTASIVASFIIILAIGGYVFVRNFDLNRYKPYIENAVFNATGRTLTMAGDAKLAISLIPTLEISDVSLSNPEWAQNPNMIDMAKLEVKFAIMPLLKKQIVIDKLILHGTQIYLETSVDGENNWNFDTQKVKAKVTKSYNEAQKVSNVGEAAVGMVLVAKNVNITEGVLNYFNAKNGKNHLLEIEDISAKLDSFDNPLLLDMVMKYNGNDINLNAKISTLNSIINNDKLDFEAKIKALNISADLRGAVDGVLSAPVYALEGNVYNPKDNFSMPEIRLDTGIDGDLSSAKVILKNLSVAKNEITGNIDVNWSGGKPVLKADLVASQFNVNSFVETKKQVFALPSIISSANALTFVPNNIVDFSALNMLNGNADLKIGKLILPKNMELNNLRTLAKLQNGILTVNPFTADFGGGKMIADAEVKASDNSIKFNFKTENMKLQEIDKSLEGKNSLFNVGSGGDVSFDINIKTSGNTYRKMSDNLNGVFIVMMDKTLIKSSNMSWLTNNILGQLLNLLNIDTSKKRDLDVDCLVIRSDFKNGKAYFPSGIVFNSDKIKMVGSGDINLVNDEMNFTIAPTLNKLADGNITQALASFVKIEGTLNNPKLRLDTSSALNTIVGAVATGGISFGGEVLLSGDDDPCRSALKNTKYADKYAQTQGIKSSTKRAYQEVNKQAKEAVKGLGNAAKNLLNSFKGQF